MKVLLKLIKSILSHKKTQRGDLSTQRVVFVHRPQYYLTPKEV